MTEPSPLVRATSGIQSLIEAAGAKTQAERRQWDAAYLAREARYSAIIERGPRSIVADGPSGDGK